MILSTAQTEPQGGAARKMKLGPVQLVIFALIAIVAIGTGVAVAEGSGGPATYACMSITHNGSTVVVTTTGLIHYVGTQYYISCNEGSALPSKVLSSSCLTISPKTILAPIGVGAATEYYYFSSTGSSVTINGAPAPTNNTEWITPAGLSLTTTC
jgi:hypothetical protein